MEGHMKLETPLHAEHQLDQLAAQFEHWRQTRTHPGERFPQALWDQAVAVAATLPPARVAKQLRLRLTDLKKQMATPHAASSLPLALQRYLTKYLVKAPFPMREIGPVLTLLHACHVP